MNAGLWSQGVRIYKNDLKIKKGFTFLRFHCTAYSFNLEGVCATLNLRIQALKQNRYKAGFLFERCYFGAIIGSTKRAKIKCM